MGILTNIKNAFLKAVETETCRHCRHWRMPTKGQTGYKTGEGRCTAVNVFYTITPAEYSCESWTSKVGAK